MRVLVITNFYPPEFVGGYELACRDVVEGLRRRGHDVLVVASRGGDKQRVSEDGTLRVLTLCQPVNALRRLTLLPRAFSERQYLKRLARRLSPDVISIWNMGRLTPWVWAPVALLGCPVAFAVSDWWMLNSSDRRWLKTLIEERERGGDRKVLIRSSTGFLRSRPTRYGAHFFSRTLHDGYLKRGVSFSSTAVIHHGVDAGVFQLVPRSTPHAQLRLLFVGQIERHKGLHTVIEALGQIRADGESHGLTLSVVGAGSQEERLKGYCREVGIAGQVRWIGKVPREELPAIYANHDVLVFPSVWEEPFSLVVLESMATGTVVVASTAGGSKEIVEHGRTGLSFLPGDAEDLARQIIRLASDHDLYRELSHRAAQLVRSNFSLDQTVERIEEFLTSCAHGARTA